MPEMTFTVRWPDGTVDDCYSPSLVVHDHLEVGTAYTVSEFTERSATALGIAAERVRARFGFTCSSSAATLQQIRRTASRHDPDGPVDVLRMHPPLPRSGAAS